MSSRRSWLDAETKTDEAAEPAPSRSPAAISVIDTSSEKEANGASSQAEAADVPAGSALFEFSSYTGGAPLIAIGDSNGSSGDAEGAATSSAHGASTEIFAQDVTNTPEMMNKHSDMDEKKMGRPSHPAWQYFVRGEKRNRFHHHAFCRFCAENGDDPVAIRGVSGNMIRHLQKCIYCPTEVVTQLKLLCAQKDAKNFNKKHQSQHRDVDLFLHDTSPIPKKKPKRTDAEGIVTSLRNAALRASGALGVKISSNTQDTTDVDDFMPLQLPLLSAEMNGGIAANILTKPLGYAENPASLKKPAEAIKFRLRDSVKMNAKARATQNLRHSSNDHHVPQPTPNDVTQAALNKLIATSTVSADLPWDWMWTEQSTLTFGELHSKIKPPTTELLSTMGSSSHEKQLLKMKDEQVGVTMAVSWWTAKYPKSNFVLLSLVNALGEATAWELIDMGIEDAAPEGLAEKIKANLTTLRRKGIHVINIVADTTFAFAASRLAVNSSDWANLAIPVLPCFSHLLQVLLGVVLTVSDRSMETFGEVIDLVRMFSNHRILKVLRRECGDPDAQLQVPSESSWYSFIEAIDSVRQYEDMIKIVALKVVQASSDAGRSTGISLGRSNPRKDSAGNTVDELAECGLSSGVIQTVQNSEFWENVVALSELMSPLKETYKMMTSTYASAFLLSDVFYQLGRMQQQYGIILSDWEDTVGGGRSVEQVRFLLRTVNNMWKLYDQPLMVLSYTFNYNLQHPFFARHQPSLQWLSIGKYAKQYFRGWFCAASSTRNPSRMLALSDEAAAQFMEDILAFKERKYPFDSESMCDFENPKLFYMLVSDTHPLMHIFGSRLFSFVTSTPSLTDVIPEMGFIPSVPSTIYPQPAMLPLLQMKLFAQTAMRPSKDLISFVQSNRMKGSLAGADVQLHPDAIAEVEDENSTFLQSFNSTGKGKAPESNGMTAKSGNVWTKKRWISIAKQWKAHWEKETDTSDLLHSSRMLDTFNTDLTLEQIFKDKLPSRLPHDREDAVVDV